MPCPSPLTTVNVLYAYEIWVKDEVADQIYDDEVAWDIFMEKRNPTVKLLDEAVASLTAADLMVEDGTEDGSAPCSKSYEDIYAVRGGNPDDVALNKVDPSRKFADCSVSDEHAGDIDDLYLQHGPLTCIPINGYVMSKFDKAKISDDDMQDILRSTIERLVSDGTSLCEYSDVLCDQIKAIYYDEDKTLAGGNKGKKEEEGEEEEEGLTAPPLVEEEPEVEELPAPPVVVASNVREVVTPRQDPGLSDGAKIAAGVGSLLAFLALIAGFFVFRNKRRERTSTVSHNKDVLSVSTHEDFGNEEKSVATSTEQRSLSDEVRLFSQADGSLGEQSKSSADGSYEKLDFDQVVSISSPNGKERIAVYLSDDEGNEGEEIEVMKEIFW